MRAGALKFRDLDLEAWGLSFMRAGALRFQDLDLEVWGLSFIRAGAIGLLIVLLFVVQIIGVRIAGALGDMSPLVKVAFKSARSRVKKGPL